MARIKAHTRTIKNKKVVVKEHNRLKLNTPVKTPTHKTKSHMVFTTVDGKLKLIRFGQQGVKGSPVKENESEEYKARREAFRARHAQNIAKGKSSPAYWANKVKW